MKTIQSVTLALSLLLAQFSLSAQDSVASNHCFSRAELLQLVHLPVSDPLNTELMDLLDAKGYQFGSDVFVMRDTIDAIELEYESHVYYDKVAGRLIPTVYVYESKNGLSNVIVLTLTHDPECANKIASDFHEGGYLYNGQQGLYSGRDGLGDQNGIYEAIYSDKQDVSITFRKQSEINSYVEQQKNLRTAQVLALMKGARHHAENMSYYKAYHLIDSAMGIYTPLDEDLIDLREQILGDHRALFYKNLRDAVNKRSDLSEGIAWCDSILSLDTNNDSVMLIRQVLSDQLAGRTQKYSAFDPEGFEEVRSSLDTMVNQEIRQHPDKKKQTLELNFQFITTNENISQGRVNLDTDRNFFQSKSKERARNQFMQHWVDSLASSNSIQPVFEYGIIVNTHEVLDAKIEWRYNELEINDEVKPSAELLSYVDTIVNNYFRVHDPSRADTSLLRMPYLREYTFGITRKQYNNTTFSDVSLTDFSTSNAISWVPSLIIPGLGTTSQGYRTSVASRAIPFFLFGGLAVAGYFLENNGKEKTAWDEGGQFWNHKNFGNILLYGGATIAATIYITDLVQSIKATFQNRSRSKKLREALKNGPIEIKMEDIYIQ